MVRTLAEATGAARADVLLAVGNELRPEATWPPDVDPAPRVPLPDQAFPSLPDADLTVPVRHGNEVLGALAIAKRPGEPLTPTEERLVHDLAAQAGLVLRNVALLEELRASRRRIVQAQDDRARELERNIHDGAQQQLVALSVKLRLTQQLAQRDTAQAEAMLEEIQSDLTEALEDLRDLARGIYPPLLADQGLAAALKAQARKATTPVTVEVDGVGRYPREVESAVYFSVLEALQNVSKYSGATRAEVRLSADDAALRFAVRDDGRGFDPRATPRGSGLQNIADRLAALGGASEVRSAPEEGTTVGGWAPIGEGATAR
jgi:signal transduction histidine kinase